MADELFADVKSEGNALDIDKAFERLETKGEESSASQTEKKPASSSRQDEKNTDSEEKTPFHKHPRWQKTQETLKQYEARIAEFEKKFADIEKGSRAVEVPQWWKNSYGDTADSQKKYQDYETATQAERDRIKAEVKADLANEVKADQTQVSQAEQFVDEQIAEMTEEGLKFDRNALLKFMVDFQAEFGAGSLLDAEGNYDFRKALAMKNRMEPEATASNETRKQLASLSGRQKVTAGSQSNIPVVSRRDLRRGWRDAGI